MTARHTAERQVCRTAVTLAQDSIDRFYSLQLKIGMHACK